MQITIQNVSVEKVKTWQVANIQYTDFQGQTKSWKLVSFANPQTFATLKDAKAGEVFDVTTAKDSKDYTQWTSATKTGEASTTKAAPAGASFATKSSYETADERARRQVLIVRQSCIAQAVASLDKNAKFEDILARAGGFEEWVNRVDELEIGDVPF